MKNISANVQLKYSNRWTSGHLGIWSKCPPEASLGRRVQPGGGHEAEPERASDITILN